MMRSTLIVAASAVAPFFSQGFSVAEVKPHFGCTASAGQDHVRDYVAGLAANKTGIIALIQFEFTLPQPEGFTAFGASCTTHHSDPVVVLVDESQFSVVSVLDETVTGNYASMPYLTSGQKPTYGSMCVADPNIYGLRGYTGAVLKNKGNGQEMCVIAGTFPHCYGAWDPKFLSNIEQSCGSRPLLFIVDTNAACENLGPHASKTDSMQDIGKNHSANWGECSDPAIANLMPTCCHDVKKGHPEAQYWYDRTALCRGGTIEDFQVHASFVCGADEEHKFTTATVRMSGNSANEVAIVV